MIIMHPGRHLKQERGLARYAFRRIMRHEAGEGLDSLIFLSSFWIIAAVSESHSCQESYTSCDVMFSSAFPGLTTKLNLITRLKAL